MTRQVKFLEQPTVISIESLAEDDVQLRWYSPKELEAMRSVVLLERNNNTSTQQEQQQGNDTKSVTKSSACRSFVMALLEQQYEHEKLGIHDPKGLFQFSRAASKQARQRAIRNAKATAEEAAAFSRETTSTIIDNVLELMNAEDFTP